MSKDLKKMAGNGYGYALRVTIPDAERNIEGWKRDKEELKRRIDSLDWLIDFHSKSLEGDRRDLEVINEKYKDIEPDWGNK